MAKSETNDRQGHDCGTGDSGKLRGLLLSSHLSAIKFRELKMKNTTRGRGRIAELIEFAVC